MKNWLKKELNKPVQKNLLVEVMLTSIHDNARKVIVKVVGWLIVKITNTSDEGEQKKNAYGISYVMESA